jgi:hypothetical protein
VHTLTAAVDAYTKAWGVVLDVSMAEAAGVHLPTDMPSSAAAEHARQAHERLLDAIDALGPAGP